MNKDDYIEAIEELNNELKQCYETGYYKKYRNKILIRKLLKTGRYKLAFQTKLNYLKSKFNSIFKRNQKKINPYKKINKNETGKIVVYTCILDDYDNLYSPLIETDNTKYIVFSDNEKITQDIKLWEYRKIPERIKKICNNNYTLINRYIKMHPFELFPNDDLALYVDGCLRIISDITNLFDEINDKTGLAMHIHPRRKDVYEEAKACFKYSLGNKKNIKKLIQKYKEEGMPEKYGLFEAGIIAIDLHNKKALEIMNKWWECFLESKTGRDQLSLTYVLWKLNYEFDDIGVLGNNLNDNPKFLRIVHNYNKKYKK